MRARASLPRTSVTAHGTRDIDAMLHAFDIEELRASGHGVTDTLIDSRSFIAR